LATGDAANEVLCRLIIPSVFPDTSPRTGQMTIADTHL